MSRRVAERVKSHPSLTSSAELGKATVVNGQSDPYVEVLVKLIPVESVAVYTALSGILAAANLAQGSEWYQLGIFLAILVGTIFYVRRVANDGVPPSTKQVVLSTLAFLFWALCVGHPLAILEGTVNSQHIQLVSALLPPLFTFIAPLL